LLDPLIKWILVASGMLLLLALGVGIAAWFFPDFRVWSRDFAVVLLAAFQMIAAIIAIVLLVALLYAVKALNDLARTSLFPKLDEISTKVDTLLETTRTITGELRESSEIVTTTTTYAAERVVSPLIRVSSMLAGVRAAAGALARRESQGAAESDDSREPAARSQPE
jgi:ABC-type maltose transport system permease subunit